MPVISVIVPAYQPTSFEALSASISANAYADAEWIVVDDGSGPDYDATFATLPDGVHLLRLQANRRQGAARNAGLAKATGRWIKFLDADDRLDAGHLTNLLDAVAGNEVIPFAPTRHVFPSGSTSLNDSWRTLAADSEGQLVRLLRAPFLHHCGALFPRELLEELGGYDETLTTDEDGDLLIRTLMTGYSFAAVPETEYFYIHHNDGERVSADDSSRKLADRERVCEKVVEAFAAHGQQMPASIRTALAQRLDTIAMSAWEIDRSMAQRLLGKAQGFCPGYPLSGRLPMRLARRIGGPDFANLASGLVRRLRGRLEGGMRA